MHQLTPSETALLTAETNTNLGHQSLCLELAPDADGEHLTLARLRAVIQDSLHLAPSLRRRVRLVPLGTRRPVVDRGPALRPRLPHPSSRGSRLVRPRCDGTAARPAARTTTRPEPTALGAVPDRGPRRRQQSVHQGPHRADRGARPDGAAVAGARQAGIGVRRPHRPIVAARHGPDRLRPADQGGVVDGAQPDPDHTPTPRTRADVSRSSERSPGWCSPPRVRPCIRSSRPATTGRSRASRSTEPSAHTDESRV